MNLHHKASQFCCEEILQVFTREFQVLCYVSITGKSKQGVSVWWVWVWVWVGVTEKEGHEEVNMVVGTEKDFIY